METKRNDYLVEFELQNSEMESIYGGSLGYSGGHMFGACWCASDRGNIQTQEMYSHGGCELASNGRFAGYGECTESPS